MVKKTDSLVQGWGINDVDYHTQNKKTIGYKDGKQIRKLVWVCPYYAKWKNILTRCLCPKLQERNPTYKGCTVTEEWKRLSDFIKWVDSQPNKDWINCEPDKDILFEGNKHYSPETVVFIPSEVNNFINNRSNKRGEYMLGVNYYPKNTKNKYRASCNNPFTKNQEYLGSFLTEIEAHKAWQAKKHEHACQLANIQSDDRIASRLREMYAPDKDWTKV